ncbi:MAG: hypothetical protein HQ468_02950 [Actinomycetales bacterium]|nr:hypothetical protein [Actinomycetales bacterium]
MSVSTQRWKDAWQLHLPLVIVLAFCCYATVIEFNRAQEGVTRAWVYTFQWPIIGIFAIVVWNRYRKHGSLTKSISKYFRDRAKKFESMEEEPIARESVDPDELAWKEHLAKMRREDPPGGPSGVNS